MNAYMQNHVSGNNQEHMTEERQNMAIKKIDQIYDKRNDRLILMVSTKEMLEGEVKAFLKENTLILEAPIIRDYIKPVHTHLIDSEFLSKFDEEASLIAFSEVKLKPGYYYLIQSCQLVNSRLVKIILKSEFSFHKTKNLNNLKIKSRK